MSDTHIVVEVLGRPLELILPGQGWTIDESRLAKRASNGMSPAKIEEGLGESDPDAWTGLLTVAFSRAGRTVTPQQLGNLDVLALAEAVMDTVNRKLEEDAKLPPSIPANGNGNSEADADAGKPAGSRTTATPEETGIPA